MTHRLDHVPATGGARRLRPRWAVGVLALGILWMLFIGCLFTTGYWATVTVTGGAGDGFCDVVWVDPVGGRHSGESDCYDEPAGSSFQVRVSGWPDAGEPTLLETYVGMGLLVGMPAALVGAGRLLYLRRNPPPAVPVPGTPRASEGPAGPALAVPETAAALARSTWLAAGAALLGIAGICAVAVLLAIEDRADSDLRRVGVPTTGTVVSVDPDSTWSSGGASVLFESGSVERARYILLWGEADHYEPDQEVDVLYDPADPDRFTIDGLSYAPSWTDWPFRLSVVAASLGGALGVVMVRARARARRLLADRVWTPTRIQVRSDQRQLTITTEDSAIWKSSLQQSWPDTDPDTEGTGWGGDPACDAWWVCDGTWAVFSPDRGRPLVVAKLKSEGPIRRSAGRRMSAAPGSVSHGSVQRRPRQRSARQLVGHPDRVMRRDRGEA